MQILVNVLGLACLAALVPLFALAFMCRSDGCLAFPIFAVPIIGAHVIVTLLGIVTWRADRHRADGLGILFRVVVGSVGCVALLGVPYLFTVFVH